MFEDPYRTFPDLKALASPGDQPFPVIPVGPCEGCRWRDACASQSLACRVFLRFVSKGSIIDGRRRPNRGTYRRVFVRPAESGSDAGGAGATLDWIDELL